MADETEAAAEDGETEPKAGGKKKKLILIGAAALVLLLGGGGAAFFLMGGEEAPAEVAMADGDAPAAEAAKPEMAPTSAKPAFFELPSMVVNLQDDGRSSIYLRVAATLELQSSASIAEAKEKAPQIVDGFQTFLRELRPRDLEGSGGLMRLKEELMVRANAAFANNDVQQVLVTEILVQ